MSPKCRSGASSWGTGGSFLDNFKRSGASFWEAGGSFWNNFGRLGRFWVPSASWEASEAAPGRFYWPRWPNLGPKMASSWGPGRTKIDANIDRIFDVFENRNLDGKS